MTTRIALTISTIVFVGVIGYAYMSLPYKGAVTTPANVQTTDTTSASSAQAGTPTTGTTQTTQPGTTGTSGSTATGGTASSGGSTKTSSGITMADVAKHNSGSSCWTTINGKVYDVTDWINQHPGGAAVILSLCGTDGSSAFDAQHGGQRRPESELANYYIGALTN